MSIIPGSSGNPMNPFSLDILDPFNDLSQENPAFINTQIDWKETPDAYVFKADVPGLKNGELKVVVEDERVLRVSGERNVEIADKNDNCVERSSSKFSRRFTLPENAKMDQIKASMENGVLVITVPKEDIKQPEVKIVQISN